MAWDKLTEADKAWIAGIFEGEGSISLQKGFPDGKKKYLRLMFYNNDISMLEELCRLIGGNLYKRPESRNKNWKPSHVLQFNKKEDIKMFIRYIYPFMRTDYKIQQLAGYIQLANKNGGDY